MAEQIQWDEKAVEDLIKNGVTESLTLDYKAADALIPRTESIKKEISKDVSAFANSAGGMIIYGVIEKNYIPVSIDGIDPSVVTREWLEQIISSRIQRRIEGVRIQQVNLSDGKVVYVVSIPQSDRAPHMSSDNRFYKRFEFMSVPMEEYEVRDVANRAIGPRLKINLWLEANTLLFKDEDEFSQPLEVKANVVNESVVPAEYVVFHWFADVRLQGTPGGFINRQEIDLSIFGIKLNKCYRWQLNWAVPGMMPIWEGMNFNLFNPVYEVRVPKGPGQYKLGWSVKAPCMSDNGRLLTLDVDQNRLIVLKEVGISLHD